MTSATLTFRFISILSLITIINIVFFGMSWRHREQVVRCSVDTVLRGVSEFILHNGEIPLQLAMSCQHHEPSKNSKESLVSAVRSVIQECNAQLNKSTPKKTGDIPLITLFSSWTHSDDASKALLHNISMRNWVSFKPMVRVVVFTNETRVINTAQHYGLHVLPITHQGGGAPVLRTMFQRAKERFPSHLYGFVNSDILFVDNFIETLQHIVFNTRYINSSTALFMTGRRTNVLNITELEAESYGNIRTIAESKGELFTTNAEDYFITNHAFPWDEILDVVIGRLAYDNWLVGHARCAISSHVIDLTSTVLAVHQTTAAGGNFEGFKNSLAHYNNILFKQHHITPVFENGFTDCAEYRTHNTFCGEIAIATKGEISQQCKCADYHKTTPRIAV